MGESSKKRILFVTHHLTVGGVQKSLISALNALDYEKNDVTLFLRKNRVDLLSCVNPNVKVIINGDKKHYYRSIKAILFQLRIIFAKRLKDIEKAEHISLQLSDYISDSQMKNEYIKYFKDTRYDIAVAYVQGPVTGFVAQCVKANKKIAFYQGSTDENHHINEKAYSIIDSIVVEHEEIGKSIIDWYDGIVQPSQVHVLENYVDVDFLIKQADEKVIERHGKSIVMCSCGRFATVKGFDLAVNAANILNKKGYDFVWYLVGDGPERVRLEKMVSDYHLEEKVFFTGMQKNPYPYIKQADIYIQPSYEEAISIAMMEAQALCAPMVTTKTVGGCLMVEDEKTGVLTDIDAKSLAQGIEKLFINPELLDSIRLNLLAIDYSTEKNRYKRAWEELLGSNKI